MLSLINLLIHSFVHPSKVGDLGYRKIPIVIPLVGYLVSRVVLLLVIVMDLPILAMFGGVVVHGRSGGFCSYWAYNQCYI